MNRSLRAQLTSDLSGHVATIAAEIREQLLAPGEVRTAGEALHVEEKVGDDYDVWTDLLSRRAAVLFVLKTVYVRVLEDRAAIEPVRLVDVGSQRLFEQLAPNLGETAYLRWVFRDLASGVGGLPELFAPQPAEFGTPSDDASRELLRLWRRTDPDTGELVYRFDGERFDGALMGDLYQELDPVVKERYALWQTPDFVRELMLDLTLSKAIREYGADAVRIIDPSCGSGHFLLDALRRLVDATTIQHPDWPRQDVVQHTLRRVVGIDLNDYACALARARMAMLALELASDGNTRIADGNIMRPNIFCADGLDQVERDQSLPNQPDLFESASDVLRAEMSRPATRRMLKPILKDGFQVVIANPPYPPERDPLRKAYQKSSVDGKRRYISAWGTYNLSSPFVERAFQLATEGGLVGLIISNKFMKRSFGKALVEKFLSSKRLSMVIDTSGAVIPNHATPTAMLFGRNLPSGQDPIRAIMGKRGEPDKTIKEPQQGEVWQSILRGVADPAFENEFISCTYVPRQRLNHHPWSLQGGVASPLQRDLHEAGVRTVSAEAESIGFLCITKMDEFFIQEPGVLARLGVLPDDIRSVGLGHHVRDWSAQSPLELLFPYDEEIQLRSWGGVSGHGLFWRVRRLLESRKIRAGGTFRMAEVPWWQFGQIPADKFKNDFSIAFSKIATHNHFAIAKGQRVFSDGAPVIKMREGASEDRAYALAGLLNSSVACFLLKQVLSIKTQTTGMDRDPWRLRYEHDARNVGALPLPDCLSDRGLVSASRRLSELAEARLANTSGAVLDGDWTSAADLNERFLDARENDAYQLSLMVHLQEELDWYVYGLYGLWSGCSEIQFEGQLTPGRRPFELELARTILDDLSDRASILSAKRWFEVHGWQPVQGELSEQDATRIRAIREHPKLRLLEGPRYKRRWHKPDYVATENGALKTWLTDRIEEVFARHEAPRNPRQVAAALQGEPRVLAAAEVYTGRADYDLEVLVAELVNAESVPNHPLHLFKPKGLVKRKAWEKTWVDQRREDNGEDVTPDVPPKYTDGDFLRSEYYKLRGKLDVPKERFIALTEVPGADESLYGWAGWTATQRFRAFLDLDEALDDQGVPVADRLGLLDSAWRLLPDVERDDPAVARRGRAELVAILGEGGPSEDALARWFAAHPPPSKRR